MKLENPFTPGFGSVPPYLAGRKGLLEDMHRAFERGKGDPNLSTIIIGPRGTGKTALLSRIAQDASASGWVTASVSAVPGMLDDVIERTCESAEELLDNSEHLRLKGVTFGQTVGLEFDHAQRLRGNWRSKMNAVLKQLDRYETGLLITVDEVQADLDEMVQLASVYQHFVQEGRRVALLMAGLPSNVSSLISSKYVSFLRRARQRHLGRIADVEVASAFRKTVLVAGGEIDDGGLDLAVSSIDGFPYMMQLVGYWTWEESVSNSIGLADVERGVRMATRDFEDGVLAATYRELSKGDLRFLVAMLPEDESALADIAARMGVASNYASKYKERLLESGVIGDCGHNTFRFDLPGFRSYLQGRMDEMGK